MKKFRKAFSLIELLIVVVILGVLASLVIPNLFKKGEKVKKELTCVKMNGLSDILKSFKSDNGLYPSTREGFSTLVSNTDEEKYKNYSEAGYLENLPTDAWGTDIVYIKADKSFTIMSYGADRQEGGDDFDKDFSSIECNKRK